MSEPPKKKQKLDNDVLLESVNSVYSGYRYPEGGCIPNCNCEHFVSYQRNKSKETIPKGYIQHTGSGICEICNRELEYDDNNIEIINCKHKFHNFCYRVYCYEEWCVICNKDCGNCRRCSY